MPRLRISENNRFQLAVMLMIGLNIALITVRILYTGDKTFAFLGWNLFLAFLPWAILVQARKLLFYRHQIPAILVTILGILFLPNAPYILTDLFHIRQNTGMPLWYDTLLLASCSATGLFFFYKSLRKLEAILLYFFPGFMRIGILALVAFMSGFGIYLGRYERFNSCDVFANPDMLYNSIIDPIIHPGQNAETWAMTIVYGIALLVLYWVMILLRKDPVHRHYKH